MDLKKNSFVALVCTTLLALTASFSYNIFSVAPSTFFISFQNDSEALVHGKIAADKGRVNSHSFGLGHFTLSDNSFSPYKSQYGIQGQILSTLNNDFKISITVLKFLSSMIFAAALLALAYFYQNIFSTSFSVIFLATIFLSPWVVSFARNLYWVPFTWAFPALSSLIYIKATTSISKKLAFFFVFSTMLLKCLSGYEYISSVILFSLAPSAYLLLLSEKGNRKKLIIDYFTIAAIGVVAFMIALCMHANLRGENIVDGLKIIYQQDVQRRTFGDPSNFPPVYAASLSASPFTVLKIYIWNWSTEIIAFIPGRSFPILLSLSAAVVGYRTVFQKKILTPDLALILAFLPVPISWFVLAKSHSFIHTHMNFVLWYLGSIAALLSVIFSGAKILFIHAYQWASINQAEDV